MKMEIEVGEYVRTKNGEIHKIMEINNPNDELWTYYKFENNMGDYKEDIVKHSKNIIDLIEVGDYVNGQCVYEILEDGRVHIITGHLLDSKDIKTVVTKEQMESIEYKV